VAGTAETNLPLIQVFRKKLEKALMESNHRQLIVNELDGKKLDTAYQIHKVLCDQSYSLGKAL
jgi:hypothetical protein